MAEVKGSWSIGFAFGYGILLLAAFVGNVIIINLAWKKGVFNKSPQTKFLILHTAVIDILSSFIEVPYVFGYVVLNYISSNYYFCEITGSLRIMLTILTPCCFLLLAVSRYYIILKPAEVNVVFSNFMTMFYIGCIWGSSACFLAVFKISNHNIVFHPVFQSCYFAPTRIIGASSLLIRTAIVVTTIYFYAKIYIVLRRQDKKFRNTRRIDVQDNDEVEKHAGDSPREPTVHMTGVFPRRLVLPHASCTEPPSGSGDKVLVEVHQPNLPKDPVVCKTSTQNQNTTDLRPSLCGEPILVNSKDEVNMHQNCPSKIPAASHTSISNQHKIKSEPTSFKDQIPGKINDEVKINQVGSSKKLVVPVAGETLGPMMIIEEFADSPELQKKAANCLEKDLKETPNMSVDEDHSMIPSFETTPYVEGMENIDWEKTSNGRRGSLDDFSRAKSANRLNKEVEQSSSVTQRKKGKKAGVLKRWRPDKLTTSTVGVTAYYIISSLLIYTGIAVRLFLNPKLQMDTEHLLNRSIVFIHSTNYAVNFFIFAIVNAKFRIEVMKLFGLR